ncbi:MAG: PIN domain-containing protein [Verrucomicrobiales bacterium]
MLGIDTNLLLYSLNPASSHQPAAERFLRFSFRDKSETVAVSDYVLVELYNHLRNQVVMKKPLGAREAVEIVTAYWKIPNVTRIEHASVMDEVWKVASGIGFARRRIFDVRLAKTLRHHGVTHFATANVKDFEGLGFEKVWNPLKDDEQRSA